MKRHFTKILALTALGALTISSSALAGGFSFGGGGGGGGGGNRMSSMRSGGSSMRMMGGSSMKPMSGGISRMGAMGSARSIAKGPGSSLMSQHGMTRKLGGIGAADHMGGGNRMPGVNPSMLKGNVRNNLLGNVTGANPRAILGQGQGPGRGPGPKLGIGGGVAGGITKQIGIHGQGGLAAKVQQIGGVGGVKIGIGHGHNHGQHHGHIHGHKHGHHGKADCHHVINLLVRHCHGTQTFDPCVKHYCPSPVYAEMGWIPAPVFAPQPFGPDMGDLELLEVHLISEGTLEQGPVYQVTVRNNGEIPAEHFRVSLVAVLGEINENSPSVTINVDRIEGGATANLQIQTPVTVLSMGPEGEAPAIFDTLVVAIDSFDELAEANELNNVATLKRAEVTVVQVEAAAPAVAVQAAPGATVTEVAPVEGDEATVEESIEGEVVAPVEGEAPAPTQNAAPAPSENIDIDNLDLGEADSAASSLFVE